MKQKLAALMLVVLVLCIPWRFEGQNQPGTTFDYEKLLTNSTSTATGNVRNINATNHRALIVIGNGGGTCTSNATQLSVLASNDGSVFITPPGGEFFNARVPVGGNGTIKEIRFNGSYPFIAFSILNGDANNCAWNVNYAGTTTAQQYPADTQQTTSAQFSTTGDHTLITGLSQGVMVTALYIHNVTAATVVTLKTGPSGATIGGPWTMGANEDISMPVTKFMSSCTGGPPATNACNIVVNLSANTEVDTTATFYQF